jgi:hypothetical protein
MMTTDHALALLRRLDPGPALPAADPDHRELLRRRIVASPGAVPRPPGRRSGLTLAVAVAAVLVAGAGAAWASGALSPAALFRSNPQGEGTAPGDLWHQRVIPATVRRVATVRIGHVGPVQLWYARTRSHGWCGALRLPSGEWLGTGRDPLDAGGVVPGCYPTRAQVNAHGAVYVLNGFDYQEDDVDARSRGGAFWRIEFGRVTIRGAVRVEDAVSGRRVPIGRAGTFALALPFQNGDNAWMRLVAYDAKGRVVGRA